MSTIPNTTGDPCIPKCERSEPWSNPYASAIISPYFPLNNTNLINSCWVAYNKYNKNRKDFDDYGAIFYARRDAFNIAVTFLDPKDLVNFSEVSKCCYLATKANVIWETQFQKLFPTTKLMPKEKCSFIPEHQFKIYYQRVNDALKNYKTQFERNNVELEILRGPHGKIEQARQNYENLGGDKAKNRIKKIITNGLETGIMHEGDATLLWDHKKLKKARRKYHNLLGWQTFLHSKQPSCQRAINQLLTSFDDQEKFEETIEESAASMARIKEQIMAGISDHFLMNIRHLLVQSPGSAGF